MTAAKEVPWATRWSIFARSTNPGTIKIPPPTPKTPERNPAATPIKAIEKVVAEWLELEVGLSDIIYMLTHHRSTSVLLDECAAPQAFSS